MGTYLGVALGVAEGVAVVVAAAAVAPALLSPPAGAFLGRLPTAPLPPAGSCCALRLSSGKSLIFTVVEVELGVPAAVGEGAGSAFSTAGLVA